jgi:glutamate dehydrogenase
MAIDDVIARYQPGVDQLKKLVADFASPFDAEGVETRARLYMEGGAPEDLSRAVARLRPLTSSSDVIDLAGEHDWPLPAAAWLYHAVGARFGFDRLRGAGGQLSSTLHWDRLAMRRLIEDLYASQQTLTAAMMGYASQAGGALASGVEDPGRDWAEALVESWTSANADEVDRADRALDEVSSAGSWTLSKVAISSTQLRELAAGARGG